MNYEEFVNSTSDQPCILPLRIPGDPNSIPRVEQLWDLVAGLMDKGIRRPEVLKILDQCNAGEFFDLDRAITLLTDRSIDIYNKQKSCPCRLFKTDSAKQKLCTDDNRCRCCGAFVFDKEADHDS